MSFLGILTSNQSTKTRIALHKKVCCWDTGSVLHFPVPVYPPRPDSYIGGGRGRVEGGGWRWPGPTQCVWVTRCGAGAACCPPQRCSPLQRRHWPQHAPRLQPQSWPGHRDRVRLVQHQQWLGSSSLASVEWRHADPSRTAIVWAEGRFMFPYVWTIFPWLFLVLYLLFVFIDVWLPSKWPESGGETKPPPLRRLLWRGSARWPVCSPGPGLDWGPDSRKIGAAALCSEPRPPDFPPRYTTITWAGTSRHSEPDRGQTRSPTPGLPSCARPRLPVLNHSKTFERGWRIDIVVAYNRPLTSSASDSDTGGGKWTTLRKSTFEKLLYINYQTR